MNVFGEWLKEEWNGDELFSTVSFQFNIEESTNDEIEEHINNIIYYIADCRTDKDSQLLISCGRHIAGRAEKPHIHVNIAGDFSITDKKISRHRNKYAEKNEFEFPDGLSCKIKKNEDNWENIQNHMAYPWKESNPIIPKLVPVIDKYWMKFPVAVASFLQDYAKGLWEASKERQRKLDVAKEKYLTVIDKVKKIMEGTTFTNYLEFKRYVSDKFYEGLEMEDMPNKKQLKEIIENASIKLGISSPIDFL